MTYMTTDWRMRECVNQMLLRVAFRARDEQANRAAWNCTCPTPLRPGDGVEKTKMNSHDEQAVRERLENIRKAFNDAGNAAKITKTPPWTIGELVDWWIQAGVAVAAWRATAKAGDGRTDGGEPWLLEAAIGILQLEDDEEWPPLWCAEFGPHWKLVEPPPTCRPSAWDRPGRDGDDYRIRLLEWCGDPRREAAPRFDEAAIGGWPAEYAGRHRNLARAALRLMRERCRFGRLDDVTVAAGYWKAYRVPGARLTCCIAP